MCVVIIVIINGNGKNTLTECSDEKRLEGFFFLMTMF